MSAQHHVIVHSTGPAWKPGIPFKDQPGVGEHAAYLGSLLDKGILIMGGPFLDDNGGGQAVLVGVTLDQAEEIAAKDPGVISGLLRWQVRPWFVAMSAQSTAGNG